MRSAPAGYHRLRPGVRCACVHVWTDAEGVDWCCGYREYAGALYRFVTCHPKFAASAPDG
jgi:hypothetical protein